MNKELADDTQLQLTTTSMIPRKTAMPQVTTALVVDRNNINSTLITTKTIAATSPTIKQDHKSIPSVNLNNNTSNTNDHTDINNNGNDNNTAATTKATTEE